MGKMFPRCEKIDRSGGGIDGGMMANLANPLIKRIIPDISSMVSGGTILVLYSGNYHTERCGNG